MTNNLISNEIKEMIKKIYLYAYYYANSWSVTMDSEYLDELLPKLKKIFEENGLDIEIFTKDTNTGRYNNYIELLFELFVNNPEMENEELSRTKYGWYDKENLEVSIDIEKCKIEDEIETIKSEYQNLIKKCACCISWSFSDYDAYEKIFGKNNDDEEEKILEKTKNNL